MPPPPATRRRAEVRRADRVVEQQLVRRAARHDAAALQQVRLPRGAQRERRALVGEQDRGALGGDPAQRLADLADDDRREPERRLVEQQQPRPRHQRAADRQHLLLAAAEQAGALVEPLAQDREQLEDVASRCRARARRTRRGAGSAPTVRSANTRRPSSVWAMPRATSRAASARRVERPSKRMSPLDHGAAVVGEQAADGAQQRRLAGAVGAQQRDGPAGAGRRARRPRARAPRRRT